MERRETEDRERRAGLGSPERRAAESSAGAAARGREDAPDEGVAGVPSWWEGGASAEDAEAALASGQPGYIYRGVRYGEPVPEPPSEPAEDDDEPVQVVAMMSEEQPAGRDASQPSWWEGGPRPEETVEGQPSDADNEEDGEAVPPSPWWQAGPTADEPAAGQPLDTESEEAEETVRRSPWWEGGPRPDEAAAAQPLDADSEEAEETVRRSPWWEGGPRPDEAAAAQPLDTESEEAEETVRQSPWWEDAPRAGEAAAGQLPDAESGEAEETVRQSPWWEDGPGADEAAAGPRSDAGSAEAAAAAPEPESGVDPLRSGVGFGESVPEPRHEPPGEPEPPPVAATPEPLPDARPTEGEEAGEAAGEPPWWGEASRPEEAGAAPRSDAGSAETILAAPEPKTGVDYLYSGVGLGESVSEPWREPPGEPEDDREPAVAAPEPQPDPLAAEADVAPAPPGEATNGTPEPDAPAAEADEVPPGERIRSLAAEICPGELLLIGAAPAALPEWSRAAATALRDSLDLRVAERKPVDAREYLRLAIVENAMGLHEEANAHLREALPRSDPFGPVLNALAVTSLALGKTAPAIVYCKEALRETGGDDSVRAAALSNLGELYDLQGDETRATEAYETAINCLQGQEDSARLSRLHLRVGRLYRRLGQPDKARLHLTDSVRLFKDCGDEAGRVQALAALGSALTESGLHEPALRSFEEAVRTCLRTADKPGAALVQDELGISYAAQDQLTRALAYFESALWLHRELGNRKDEAATLNHIGKIHDSRGDADEAQRFYDAALRIGRELGLDDGAAGNRPQGGADDGARERHLKAEEILRRAGSVE